MKKSVKLISLVLLTVIFAAMFVNAGFAAETDNSLHYVTVYMGEECNNVRIADNVTEGINWDGVFTCLKNGVAAHQDTIDISSFNIPYVQDNVQTLSDYLHYKPCMLKCLKDNSFGLIYAGENILKISVDYRYTEEEYNKMVAECEDVIIQLLYGIKDNSSLTTAEKCLLAHDRLATWCEYDTDNLKNETIPNESFSAYGPLVKKIGVCEGIALAYGWMLDEMGIENYFVSSSLLAHGWNVVYIDGEAYFVDVTWDDPSIDCVGKSEHGNFLMPYSEFSKNHNEKGVTDYTTEPTSTTYVNSYWTSSSAEAQVINGKIYYIDSAKYNKSDCKADVVCRDLKTGTSTVLFTISDKWGTSAGYYGGNFSFLTSIGNVLYYSTPKSIHAYNVDTKVDTVYYTPTETSAADKNIYGFTQKNGTLYIFIHTTPNLENTSDGTVITKTVCSEHSSREKLSGVEATCITGGSAKYICKDCRALFTVTIAPGEHSYTVYVGEKEPASCTKNRIDTYKCATCTATTEKEIENTKTDHNYTEYVSEKEPATCMKNSICIYKCATCDLTTEKEVPDSKKEHTWDIYVRVKSEATCTEDRVDIFRCSVCNSATLEKHISGTKIPHNFSEYVSTKIAATCSNDRVDIYKCATCTATTEKEIENTKKEHDYSVYVSPKSPATCIANRVDVYKCANCDTTTEKEIENTKTDHNYTEYVSEKEPATCMKNSIGIYKCATCDLTTEKEVPDSKKEHTWDIYVGVKKEATCTEDRVDIFRCSVCNSATLEKHISGTKIPHNFSEFVSTKTAATCSNDRVDVYKCKNCTTTTEKVIANTKTKHSLQKVDAVKATATTTGNIEYYCCENCKAMFKDSNAQTAVTLKEVTIPATGKELLPGDVDGDGKVSAADARLALRASVGLENYPDGSDKFILADVDEDGKISAADARLILRASVGLEELKFKKSK